MPNWTTNILCVYGPAKDVKRFMKVAQTNPKVARADAEKYLDFNSFVRMPELLTRIATGGRTIRGVKCDAWFELGPSGEPEPIVGELAKEVAAKCDGFTSWYDWACQKWGTKWNACRVEKPEYSSVSKDKAEVTYRFDTAWAPPMPVLVAASKMFPMLTFDLHEDDEGDSDWHEYQIKNGEVKETDSGEKE